MMKIETLCVGSLEANCFLVYDSTTKEALLIDPGAEAKRILKRIAQLQLTVHAILLTHGHCDHIGAVNGVQKQLQCPLIAHKKERDLLGNPDWNHSTTYIGSPLSLVANEWISDGHVLTIGSNKGVLIHTPGHTPGGLCLWFEEAQVLFTGDTLFADDIGRWDLQGGDLQLLKKSLQNKLFKLPDSTQIYSGHGEAAELGVVKKRIEKSRPF